MCYGTAQMQHYTCLSILVCVTKPTCVVYYTVTWQVYCLAMAVTIDVECHGCITVS